MKIAKDPDAATHPALCFKSSKQRIGSLPQQDIGPLLQLSVLWYEVGTCRHRCHSMQENSDDIGGSEAFVIAVKNL